MSRAKKKNDDLLGRTFRSKNRCSERTMPLVSEDEAVVVHSGSGGAALAKLMDLSDTGLLVYLLEGDVEPSAETKLSLFHKGKIFKIRSKLVRRYHRLAGFQFVCTSTIEDQIRTKLLHMKRDQVRSDGNSPS
jgi:hypothetical protein